VNPYILSFRILVGLYLLAGTVGLMVWFDSMERD